MLGIRAPARRARPQGARAGDLGHAGRDLGELRSGRGRGQEELGQLGIGETGALASGVARRRGPDQRRGSLAAKKGLTSFL
jgi:hypothetical protein